MDDLKREEMEWMKVYLTLLGHRKVRYLTEALATLLKNDFLTDAMTSGIILTLWMECSKNYPYGEITGCPNLEKEIAKMCQWNLPPAKAFVDALVRCRWLDETESGYHVHHWEEHRKEWMKHLKLRAAWRVSQKKRRNELKQLAEDGRILREALGPEYDAEPLRKSPKRVSDESAMSHKDVNEMSLGHHDDVIMTSAMTSPETHSEVPPNNTKNKESSTESTTSEVMTSLGHHNDIPMTSLGHHNDPLLLDVDVDVEKDKEASKPDASKLAASASSISKQAQPLGVYFLDEYLKKTGKPCKSDGGVVIGAMKTLLKDEHPEAIKRGIDFYFQSHIPWVVEINWSLRGFITKFNNGELDSGPLIDFKKGKVTTYGRHDKRPAESRTRDDFGILGSGDESEASAGRT